MAPDERLVMTTPTPLAETIARADRALNAACLIEDVDRIRVQRRDLFALLACARRCEAMDGVGGTTWRDLLHSWGVAPTGRIHLEVQALLDAASERDALAKRVRELEELLGVEESGLTRAELLAEADRLRAENERLAKGAEVLAAGIRNREQEYLAACAELDERTADLTAAQDRVRELEDSLFAAEHIGDPDGAIQTLARLVHLHGNEAESRAIDALRHVSKEAIRLRGPITDPTQGVDYVVGGIASTEGNPAYHQPAEAIAFKVKPSCIPPDCQHFEQLPSGLWAWIWTDPREQWVEIERLGKEALVIEESDLTRLDAGVLEYVSEPDFLAARALGVRVLGWAK
jgi:hypothetical protein